MAKTSGTDDKTNLLQNDSIQHYLGEIRGLLDDQILSGITAIRKENIMTKSLKDLIILVKNRWERVLKALAKERMDGEFQPFVMIEQIPKIEKQLWNIKTNTRVYGLNTLRS